MHWQGDKVVKKKPSSGLFTPENFQLYIPGNRARGNDMDCAAPDPAGELSSSLERDFEQICRKDPEHMRGLLHHFSLQEEEAPVEKFKTFTLSAVRYKYNLATMAVYIIHKDADGKYDTLKRQSIGTLLADKTIAFKPLGMVQHKVARSFMSEIMSEKTFTSKAKHPDDTDLDM